MKELREAQSSVNISNKVKKEDHYWRGPEDVDN